MYAFLCGGVAYYYYPTPEGRPREAARALGGGQKGLTALGEARSAEEPF